MAGIVQQLRKRARELFPEESYFWSARFEQLIEALSEDIPRNWQDVERKGEGTNLQICCMLKVEEAIPWEFLRWSNWFHWLVKGAMCSEHCAIVLRQDFYRPVLWEKAVQLLEQHFSRRQLWVCNDLRDKEVILPRLLTKFWKSEDGDDFKWVFQDVNGNRTYVQVGHLYYVKNVFLFKLVRALQQSRQSLDFLAQALAVGGTMRKVFYDDPLGDLQVVRLIAGFL